MWSLAASRNSGQAGTAVGLCSCARLMGFCGVKPQRVRYLPVLRTCSWISQRLFNKLTHCGAAPQREVYLELLGAFADDHALEGVFLHLTELPAVASGAPAHSRLDGRSHSRLDGRLDGAPAACIEPVDDRTYCPGNSVPSSPRLACASHGVVPKSDFLRLLFP